MWLGNCYFLVEKMFHVGRTMVYVWGEMLYVYSGNLNLPCERQNVRREWINGPCEWGIVPWGWENGTCWLENVQFGVGKLS